jgi:hypothetical protein
MFFCSSSFLIKVFMSAELQDFCRAPIAIRLF